jgi:hypothetical protein
MRDLVAFLESEAELVRNIKDRPVERLPRVFLRFRPILLVISDEIPWSWSHEWGSPQTACPSRCDAEILGAWIENVGRSG